MKIKPTKRGFGSPRFVRARQREIASLGGKAAHAKGTAHKWTLEEARAAGRLGGLAVWEKNRATAHERIDP